MNIVFMGTPDFSVPVLKRLINEYNVTAVVTQPDRPVGRKKVLTPPPVKAEALKHNVAILQPERIREREEIDRVLAFKPDLIVTAAFGQILPKELLEYPMYGCINVHASLLPKYRGGAPIHQAIIDGQHESGVTIMYMVEKLDAGDMISQVSLPIEENDHVGSLHDKLSAAGASLLMETIPKLLDGTASPVKQNEAEVTFARNISREMELIDWRKTGEDLYNQVRGLHPWPVAYTTLDGKPLKIWWAKKVSSKQQAEPGTIIAIEDEGIIVATGNETALELVDIQPSGKKRMDAGSFLRGAGSHLKSGMKLGVNHD